MYVGIYIYIYIHTYIHTFIHMYIYPHARILYAPGRMVETLSLQLGEPVFTLPYVFLPGFHYQEPIAMFILTCVSGCCALRPISTTWNATSREGVRTPRKQPSTRGGGMLYGISYVP